MAQERIVPTSGAANLAIVHHRGFVDTRRFDGVVPLKLALLPAVQRSNIGPCRVPVCAPAREQPLDWFGVLDDLAAQGGHRVPETRVSSNTVLLENTLTLALDVMEDVLLDV